MRRTLWLCLFFFIPMSFAHQNVLLQQIERLEHPKITNDFFKTHQLLFFFASRCPHCHKAAPHLKTWVKLHKASVVAVSFDRQPLPDFPDLAEVPKSLIQTAYAGQPIATPAVFVMNKQTNQLYPALMGEWTWSELDTRLRALIEKIERYEGGR